MVELGKSIAHFRKKSRLSQADLAEMVFVTPQAVSRWEKGWTEPDVQTLRKLSKIFGVPLSVMLGEISEEELTFQKVLNVIYLSSSTFIILFAIIVLIVDLIHYSEPLRYVFIVVSGVYLVMIFGCEVYKTIRLKLHQGNQKIKKEKIKNK